MDRSTAAMSGSPGSKPRPLDLDPIDRIQARALVEASLGAIDEGLEDELWRLAAGNPLVLHELIEGAAKDTLEQTGDGVWTLVGTLAESPRLADLVTSRLLALPDQLRSSMDVVAVGAPLSLDLLRTTIGDDVETLDNRNMISTAAAVGGSTVVAAHPLYGEILKANIGESRKQAAYARLVEATMTTGSPADAVRAAIWQRDSGSLMAPGLALEGATEALIRHEPALAEELVLPLGTDDDRAAPVLGRH